MARVQSKAPNPQSKSQSAQAKPPSAYSEKNVAAATARLPGMASKDIKTLLTRAQAHGLDPLAAACEAELAKRPFDFSQENARAFDQMAGEVVDMDLEAAIRHAFTKVRPADEDESTILRWIAANPDTSYQEVLAHYGKGDLSLVVGHLVYHRFGCFRQFIPEGEDQSSVLLAKDRAGKSVKYRLQPAAEGVFRDIGLV